MLVWGAASLAIGVLLGWGRSLRPYQDDQLWLAIASVAASVVMVLLLLSLRSNGYIVMLYVYLLAPYPGNRILGEVWLGGVFERAAGTVAPLMLGDLFLVYFLVRWRRRLPLGLTAVGVLLLLPLLGNGFEAGFKADAFAYQYLVWIRALLFGWLTWLELCRERRRTTEQRLTFHLGIIFAAMALVLVLVTWLLQQRIGIPGWGNNVLANALCVTGAYLAAQALTRRNLVLGLFALACLVGIVGTGTRVALALFLATVVPILLLRLTPRVVRPAAAVILVVSAVLVLVTSPGAVIAGLGEVNGRIDVLGGRAIDPSMNLSQLVSAASSESSMRTRLQLWRASVAMVEARPLTGVGWGQWNWRKSEFGVEFDVLLDPHNGYLWLFAEGGTVVALLLLGYLVVCLARLSWSPAFLALCLVLALEVTNAGVQKAQYSVLVAVLSALALYATRRRRPNRR